MLIVEVGGGFRRWRLVELKLSRWLYFGVDVWKREGAMRRRYLMELARIPSETVGVRRADGGRRQKRENTTIFDGENMKSGSNCRSPYAASLQLYSEE
jgi:hypothetical protein